MFFELFKCFVNSWYISCNFSNLITDTTDSNTSQVTPDFDLFQFKRFFNNFI